MRIPKGETALKACWSELTGRIYFKLVQISKPCLVSKKEVTLSRLPEIKNPILELYSTKGRSLKFQPTMDIYNTDSRLSDLDKVEACELFKTGNYTYTALAKRYGVSPRAMSSFFYRRGYRAHKGKPRIYTLNENYFDVIGENQAYILGLLYTDGYNNVERNRITLSLQARDKTILEKIALELGSNRPLALRKARNPHHSNQYELQINSKRISSRLEELGMVQAKSRIVTYPDWMPEDMHRHFIRGCYDGDGYIGPKQSNYIGTPALCEGIAAVLRRKLSLYVRVRPFVGQACNALITMGARGQLSHLYSWLYNDAELYIERKYETAMAYIKTYPPKKYVPNGLLTGKGRTW